MATLVEKQTGTRLTLAATTLVGSGSHGLVRIEREGVSEVHSLIRWQGHRWVVKDLGSRNGTFVDGKRVLAATVMPLYEGDEIAFGSHDSVWVLEDDRPPSILAVNLHDRSVVQGQGGMLGLPDVEEPLAMAIQNREGVWSLEMAGEVSALGEEPRVVVVGDTAWRIYTPLAQGLTTFEDPGWRLEELALLIQASEDTQHVSCWFVDNGGLQRQLPDRPTPYRVLALLGRAMLEDRHKSIAERGWRHRDYVLSDLEATPNTLDSWVFWCRRCARQTGVVNGQQLIERTNKGYLRLGVVDVVFDE